MENASECNETGPEITSCKCATSLYSFVRCTGCTPQFSNPRNSINVMYLTTLLVASAFLGLVSAIVPEVGQLSNTYSGSQEEPGHQSLPDLLQINDIKDLDLTWESYNLRYDTGRLILDKGAGSLWSIAQLANSGDEWTAELTFRSSGTSSQDGQFHDNGIALWFVDPENTPITTSATENFGGPSYYDGFQILINNKESSGLRVFMNDGSVARQNHLSDSIGNCGFNYLDSTIPFTVRVSYSKIRRWFKVQVDNNLCFKTDTITIPSTVSDFRFGVTANSNPQSLETFEVLKLSIWSTLTEDAIDDHGLMADGSVKVQYKTVVVGDEGNHVQPAQIRQSLMERTRQYQQQMAGERGTSDQDILLNEIASLSSRFQTLENVIAGLGNSQSSGGYDGQAISRLQGDLQSFQLTITDQFSNMVDALSTLNQKVIGEVREHQHGMDELSRKVDLLMANHKEIAHQYSSKPNYEASTSEITTTVIRWVLTPVVLCIVVLSVFIYRLRHDIKHSKLL